MKVLVEYKDGKMIPIKNIALKDGKYIVKIIEDITTFLGAIKLKKKFDPKKIMEIEELWG